jgi:hypothetical protein
MRFSVASFDVLVHFDTPLEPLFELMLSEELEYGNLPKGVYEVVELNKDYLHISFEGYDMEQYRGLAEDTEIPDTVQELSDFLSSLQTFYPSLREKFLCNIGEDTSSAMQLLSWYDLKNAVMDAAKDSHHNATMTKWPDIEDDREWEAFWEVLADNNYEALRDLEDAIQERFGERVKLYTTGRSGATVIVDDWSSHAGGGRLYYDEHKLIDEDYSVSGYENLYRKLFILEYINRYCKEYMDYLPEWWKDMKEANEWNWDEEEEEDYIDEEEGEVFEEDLEDMDDDEEGVDE